jgi:WD40 repeat protein/DNA-binding SARP family transcriptional activator
MGETGSLEISTLGGLSIRVAGQPLTTLKTRKVEGLLVYLACNPREHPRESLAELFWQDRSQAHAMTNLRSALSDLRQRLEPFVHITRESAALNSQAPIWIDVAELDENLVPVRDPTTAAQVERAIELYKGPFLEGFYLRGAQGFDEWATLERERVGQQALQALSDMVAYDLLNGAFRTGIAHASRLLALDPLMESAHRQMILLLAASGLRSAALAQYESCRSLLENELGVGPTGETQELYELLVRGEHPPGLPQAAGRIEQEPAAIGACPYRGLAVFREQDAPFFFGRQAFTDTLFQAVHQRPPLAVIVGSSGSGKSSAVSAGLLPRLREDVTWLITDCRPGDRPFDALAAALFAILEPDASETDRLIEAAKLATALSTGDLDLYSVVQRAIEKRLEYDRLLLIVDQFEELYTLCPDPKLRQCFLNTLLDTVEDTATRRDSPFVLLLTMRADFMGQALTHRPFADALQQATLMMGPMSRQELRAAIVKPAEMQGAAFEVGLVERLLDDVGQEPGSLPLLEFALTLLWDRQAYGWMTHAGYEEIGRVKGALARYADEVFAELDAAEQEVARRVFVQLVRPGEGTEDTRRVATRAELGSADTDWTLVQHLANKRLVVTGRDATGVDTVEVVHEALIQRWGQLRSWMEEDRAFRIWQERLRATLRGWEASDQDEGALLRGVPLAKAESWREERGAELSAAESSFIQTGVELRDRRQSERELRRRRVMLALVGGLVFALVLLLLAGQQWRRAEGQVDARSTAQAETLRQAGIGLAAHALAELEAAAPELAVLLALEALERYPYSDQAESVLAQAVEEFKPYTLLPSSAAEWYDAAWSPDGKLVAAVGGYYVAVRDTLVLWNVDAITLTESFPIFAEPLSYPGCRPDDVAWSPDGNHLVVSSQTFSPGTHTCPAPRVYDRSGRSQNTLVGHAGNANAVDWSPDGSAILTAGDDGTVKIWQVEESAAYIRIAESATLAGHTGPIWDGEWSPSGDRLATASQDGTARVWDAQSGAELLAVFGHAGDVNALTWSPDGERLATAGADGTARVWALPTGSTENEDSAELLLVLAGHGDQVRSLDWAPDGTRIATIGEEGTTRVWDAASGGELFKLLSAGGYLDYVVWSPTGDRLLTEGGINAIRVWDLSRQPLRLPDHEAEMHDAKWSPNGRYLATTCLDGSARLFDAANGEELRTLDHPAGLWRFAWSPDGKRVITVQETGALWIWDVLREARLLEIAASDAFYSQPDWSPDGSRIVAAASSYYAPARAVVFDAVTGDAITTAEEPGCRILRMPSWSPDGDRFVTCCEVDGEGVNTPAIIWDAATGESVYQLPSQDGQSSSADLSPDGTRIAVCYSSGLCKVWEADTGNELATFSGHTVGTWDVTWSPDGTRIVSADDAGTIKVWEASTGAEVLSFSVPAAAMSANWSPDGNYVIVAGYFNTPVVRRVWPSTDELIAYAKECCVQRELTDAERQQFGVPLR